METTRFPFALDDRARPYLRLFGVTGVEAAYADVDETTIGARFGRFSLSIPTDDVSSWRIEGPWRSITALGVRWGVLHGDITFGGTRLGGIRLDLAEPIRFGPLRPRTVYLTVADLEAMGSLLTDLGIPGRDVRSGMGPR